MRGLYLWNDFTVKVGGMRVVQHKRATSESEKVEEKPAETEVQDENAENDVTQTE